jgi:pimeloyl-ACP methyl ester carboxylesterase
MKAIINQLDTNYLDEGRGDVILFLHGWGANYQTFAPLIKALSPHYRLLALDLPGFGSTQSPPEAWELTDYIHFVKAFLRHRHVQRLDTIIGHSFGGRLILLGHSQGQLTASRYVFIDAAGIKPKMGLNRLFYLFLAKTGHLLLKLPFLRPFITKLYQKLSYLTDSDDYLATKGVMRATFRHVIRLDLRPLISQINRPTLIVWGDADTVTPLADAHVFAQIPDSRLIIVPHAGHYSWLDQPKLVITALKEFLAS